MNTVIFDLDQQRCETQAAIAESLYISGESDGFDRVSPTSCETEYLLGYASGYRRRSDTQCQDEKLETSFTEF